MKDLVLLVKDFPELTVNVKLSDLIECNRELINEAREQFEKERSLAQEESYPTVDEVSQILGVGKTTLWRWAKQKYLIPVEVGGKRKYRMSDVKKLLEGGDQ